MSGSSEITYYSRRKRRKMKRHTPPDHSSQFLHVIKALQQSHVAVQATARLDMGQYNNEEVPHCSGQQGNSTVDKEVRPDYCLSETNFLFQVSAHPSCNFWNGDGEDALPADITMCL